MPGVWYEDGKRKTSPEYRSWQMMRDRCLNPKSRSWEHYGAKGVRICERWNSFSAFLADVGHRPSPAHTLDRIDPTGWYTPDNVRWATRATQARNRPYCRTKAWVLAEALGVSVRTANHMIWQVRAKDRGDTRWFQLSKNREDAVRKHLAVAHDGYCHS